MYRMSISLLAAAGLSVCVGQVASAADMLTKAPVYKAAPAPAYNWTGLYIGGNAGWVKQSDPGTTTYTNLVGVLGTFPVSGSPSGDTSQSILGGVGAGYNWQFAQNWLLGVEGDFDWTKVGHGFCRPTDFLTAASSICADGAGNNRGFLSFNDQTNWLATFRGRLGWTWDRFLVFGTGGVAWGEVDTTVSAFCNNGGCGNSIFRDARSVTATTTNTGWVAGGGVEAMLSANWTAKIEYLHYDLGNVTNGFSVANAVGTPQYSTSWTHAMRYDTVRFGVNYKLDWGAPLAARY
jgi:outer membrane immunogenic protein